MNKLNSLDFLIPDALVPGAQFGTDSAPELLRGLALPHLDFLAAHALESETSGPLTSDAGLTPWQAWLLRTQTSAHQAPNLAEVWASALGHATAIEASARWLVEPVHLQIGLDGVGLGNPAWLQLTEPEAHALAEAAHPILSEDGWQLAVVSHARWLISRNDVFELQGVAIERVIGQGIEQWLPHSENAAHVLAWKRTVNEIQMTWFNHSVNLKREAQGHSVINGLWLSGNGQPTKFTLPYCSVSSTLPLLNQPLEMQSVTGLETFDHLSGPSRAQDWSTWRNALQALDVRLGEIVESLRNGQLQTLRLVLCGEHGLRDVTIKRGDFWKFWRRGQAIELLVDVE